MAFKRYHYAGIWFTVFISFASTVVAQQTAVKATWQELDRTQLRQASVDRPGRPNVYRAFRLNRSALDLILDRAGEDLRAGDDTIVDLPMPDGSLDRFRIEHSLVVEPGLLKNYPELAATYRGQGIDDPTATVRFDVMPTGFHAIVLSGNDTVYIEPYETGRTLDYISFYHNDSPPDWFANECMVPGSDVKKELFPTLFSDRPASPSVISGSTLRTYRLAVGATAEYTQAYGGGTVSGALASIVTTINFVDAIYEREVAIHFVLVADEVSLIFTDPVTDGYTHENISSLLTENQTKIDAVIGPANYDIGHVFDGRILGGGFSYQGQAGAIGNACAATGKARGVDIFRSVFPGDSVAYYNVAHEFGHQFGATHTMNGTGTGCAGARTSFTAFEPGSGSTIMGYRWNCSAQDLRSSDTYFHNASLEQIVAYSTLGTGSCGVQTATGNHEPTVNAGSNFTIPKTTPFALTATGSDPDGDPVAYTWEEADLGPLSPPDTDADGQARPILRSFLPTTSGATRNFPSLTYILNNANLPPTSGPCPIGGGTCLLGEALPSITRTMNFRVTARDNRMIGALNSATMQVNVDGNSGPFAITSPNTNVTYSGGSVQTVTWNVANTEASPVSAANVTITLSKDGGNTFPTVLATAVPNDGSQPVVIPPGDTTSARIKVAATGNIFFDISNTNFTISGFTQPARPPAADFDGDGKSDVSVWRGSDGNWYWINSSDSTVSAFHFGASGDIIVPGDYDGDGKSDFAVFRAGTWYIWGSTAGFSGTQFGLGTDLPAQGDFDGDGKTDIAVFRPSNGTWYIQASTAGFSATQFGANGDKPVVGDYDGDGKADIAVFRPTDGNWYQLQSTAGFAGAHFGISTDKVVPADYDGDGKTDLAVYRDGSPGTWFLLESTAGFVPVTFGTTNDTPVPGDFDGDGKADVSVFRPTNGTWYLQRSTSGFAAQQFGIATDKPVPASYVPNQ